MWWSDRRAVLVLMAAGLLSACGFTPAYGPQGAAPALTAGLSLSDPVTRNDYLLNRRIEERLGRATIPTYRLKTQITVSEQGLGTTDDGDTTRVQLVGSVRFQLSLAEDDRVVIEGETDGFTGYSTTGSTVATMAAERDAEARLMTLLADQIVDRLILGAADLPRP